MWGLKWLLRFCSLIYTVQCSFLLQGIENNTRIQTWPISIRLVTNSSFSFVTLNHEFLQVNEDFIIKGPGYYQIDAVDDGGTQRFVFEVGDVTSNVYKRMKLNSFDCNHSIEREEVHMVVLWASVHDRVVENMRRYMEEMYTGYSPCLKLVGRWKMAPSCRQGFDETWYTRMYGSSYYGIYFDGHDQKVDMVTLKGSGAFHVFVIQDTCAWCHYGEYFDRGYIHIPMFHLKNNLRSHAAHWYDIHATITLLESQHAFQTLFHESSGFKVLDSVGVSEKTNHLVYSCSMHTTLYQVPIHNVMTAIIQSEFYKYNIDVPAMQQKLHEVVWHPNYESEVQNMLRTSLVAHSHLNLLLHIPADTIWVKAKLPLSVIQTFRIIGENGWEPQLRCATASHAAFLYKQDKRNNNDPHYQKIEHIRSNLNTMNRTMVVLGTNTAGPFTIWDGNHRAIAFSTSSISFDFQVYIGISAEFHSPMQGAMFCN